MTMSWQVERQLEREEANLEQELEEGTITQKEYNDAMRELQRNYRAAAEESAQGAYEAEMERW